MVFPADQYRRDIHGRGREAVLVRKAQAAADDGAPWDGTAAGADPIRTTLTMKFKPIRLTDTDGDRVLESDQIVQIYGPDLTGRDPLIGDAIEDGSAV
ncbi:MAG: hypothetical protein ACR2RE_07600, partial [Geminicoccaceae bacterium]